MGPSPAWPSQSGPPSRATKGTFLLVVGILAVVVLGVGDNRDNLSRSLRATGRFFRELGWERWTDVLQVVLGVVTLVLVLIQIRRLQRTASEDLDQRRRQATLDFLTSMQTERRLRSAGVEPTGSANFQAFLQRAMHQGSTEEDKVKKFLNFYERLAVGTNHRVFEVEVVNALWGSIIVSIFDNYRPWIDAYRTRRNNHNLWIDLEKLADRLRSLP